VIGTSRKRTKSRPISQHVHYRVQKVARINEATLRALYISVLPSYDATPGKTGTYRMHALKSKVLLLIACALAMAIVILASVYFSVDAASLSAEKPLR
jgi:hypothetical protein